MSTPVIGTASEQAIYGRLCRLTFYIPTPGLAGAASGPTTSQQYVPPAGGAALTVNPFPQPGDPVQRVSFEIAKTQHPIMNTTKITVTNLSDASRKLLSGNMKGAQMRLETGYVGIGYQTIFFGDIRTIDHLWHKGDWNTVAQAGDGGRAFRYSQVNESFGPGTPKGTVLLALAQATGLDLGNAPQVAASLSAPFQSSFVATGPASKLLTKFLHSLNPSLGWSIESGAIQIAVPGEPIQGPVPFISPSSGLVDSSVMGTPEVAGKPALLKFHCLLIPVKVGMLVHLKDATYDTQVQVWSARMVGDTHANEWYTYIDGVPLSPS